MFLKSLILRGFKTFADQTEIEFQDDARITSIVGPNGCGKSNVLDATRWVLGEDNPRRLRVSNLSDIIFAGTSERKALSLAEVTMVFDNTAGKLPLAFSEVSIKRRTFREGESEFFINKNQCRLKDIKDLLLDTGLGEGTYSIITQGQVDAILSSKGEERRAVFEEAAGINKYKFRKLSAEKKLIAAEQNILRISDLKIEVSEHLINLEEQAKKAREYLDISEKVKQLDIGLSKKLLQGILEKRDHLLIDLERVKQESLAQQEAEARDEEELLRHKEQYRQLELEIDELMLKLDEEKDQLRDIELDRRFTESETKRDQQNLVDLDRKASELCQRSLAIKTSLEKEQQGFDGSNLVCGTAATTIVKQTQALVATLSVLLASLGNEKEFSLNTGASQDKEEAYKLKLEMLVEEEQRLSQEKERLQFSLKAHQSQLETLNQKTTETKNQQTALNALNQKKLAKDDLFNNISKIEEKLRGEDKDERKTINQEAAIEIALAKLEVESSNIVEKLSLEYNLSLDDLNNLNYEIPSLRETKKQVEEGKLLMRSLEPVNLLAIEEFDKNKERLSFIEAQLADLNTSRNNLRSLITELDFKAEETFIQTMQQISEVFSETFAKLFVGGEAKIYLQAGVSPLEADIEISVRPSGRKWLPLPMLSGGERSLSAIAILFSLLKIRPAAFCFMDEVDAALDDANIGRFTEMLKDFSTQSQIIVISHSKKTMAVADNIYGVTMEEPGVSKTLSMKLAQAAR